MSSIDSSAPAICRLRTTPPISINWVWSKPFGAGLVVIGCTLSSAMSGIGMSSGLTFATTFRIEGAFATLSSILNFSPNLYFAHSRSSIANGMASCRRTTNAPMSSSFTFN